jgi:hypothetical protein
MAGASASTTTRLTTAPAEGQAKDRDYHPIR